MMPLKIGVVFFFDFTIFDSGFSAWACCDGKNVAEIHRVEELDPHVTWITNIGDKAFLAAGGGRLPHLRPDQFLGTPLSTLLPEIGMPVHAGSIVCLYEIARRAMDFAGSQYHLDLSRPSLPMMIQPDLVGAPDPSTENYSADLRAALNEVSNDAPLPPFARVTSSMKGVHCPMKRLPHLINVSTCFVPEGNWMEIEVEQCGTTVREQMEWVRTSEQPLLIQASILGLDAKFASIPAKSFRPSIKRWIAHPEIALYNAYATLVPERIFVADGYVLGSQQLRQPIQAPEPIDYASISAGVVGEAVVLALTKPELRMNPEGKTVSVVTARSAWMASEARLRTTMEAMVIANCGHSIAQIGPSHVFAYLHKGERSALSSFAGTSLRIPGELR